MSDHKPCKWHENSDGNWESDCDNIFCFEADNSPAAHGFKFCPYCGGPLQEYAYEESADDAD